MSTKAASVPSPLGKQPFPWHLLGFAVSPILSLYATNLAEAGFGATVRPLMLTVAIAVVLTLFWTALLRNLHKGSVVASGWLLLWFSYGQGLIAAPAVIMFLSQIWPLSVDGGNLNRILIPVWTILALVLVAVAARSKRNFSPLTQVLNVCALALIALPLVTCVSALFTHRAADQKAGRAETTPDSVVEGAMSSAVPHARATAQSVPTAQSPDIYYIILDTYGRQDRIKQFFGMDNEPFLKELEKRGFFIARQGRPNYVQTTLSLASSLNMTYLDDVAKQGNNREGGLDPASRMVDHNQVAAFLRTKGYRWVAITNEFPPTHISTADVVMNPDLTLSASRSTASSRTAPKLARMTAFEGLLLAQTPLVALPHTEHSLYDEHREIITTAFKCLEDAPNLPYRKFVFVHILAPHPPFVFGPNGESVEPDRPFTLGDGSDFTRRSSRSDYRTGYVAQLQYVNKRTLAALDVLLSRSKVRPIIIIQGDHGSRMELDWQEIGKSNLPEAFSNLNAFSLPDGKSAQVFYPSITPVNSFRLLFNHQFNTNFAPLPDRCYYSTLSKPFQFTDVTSQTATP